VCVDGFRSRPGNPTADRILPLMHHKYPIQIAANADHNSDYGMRIETALNRVMGLLGKFAAVRATSG